MNPSAEIDVLIVGCGPAGAALAVVLAREGRRVVVIERTADGADSVGESLAPIAVPILERLGLWDAPTMNDHVRTTGTICVWGRDRAYENAFIFSPYGAGYQLDRRRFNHELLAAARKAGAQVMCGATVGALTQASGGHWRVALGPRAGREITARFVVDATGRAAPLARQLGARRLVLDSVIAVIGYGRCAFDRDSRTAIEAVSTGWWYSARLPSDRAVAAFFTGSKSITRGRAGVENLWRAALRDAPLAAASFADPRDVNHRVTFAGSDRLTRIAGTGWLAVGDAAAAHDPLSGQGIAWALSGGVAAAHTVSSALDGDGTAVASYTAAFEREMATYIWHRDAHYTAQRRWSDSPFWSERRKLNAHF